ncbi:hypothetical protein EX895_002142 [Sporisorium graminicola]|uniref:J domain-containing protein n=1 Tax=Sporisorium graminicola TaxID=280036 RepID=A0A4U7KW47_9BASI|nr:hypothetical protein EX895_002142 [Sporisorium graminicola]TKY88901.1 hypothetical protein EX895_002142 [Sporisorium graminicola]
MNRFPETDPYEVLGVARGCTSYEIKTAYKKLAFKHHPDRAAPAEKEAATARFKVVGEAYEYLSDDRKRREYDAFGPGRSGRGGYPAAEEYEDDLSRKHFGTSPDGVPFSFVWESGADSARRAQAGQRAGRPFGADGHDPFGLFNMMFGQEFGSRNGGGNVGGARWAGQDPFGMMNGGASMGGSLFGDNDPFLQNHRRMADTAGFGFGAPFPFASSRGPTGPPQGRGMQSAGPFATSSSSSSMSSTTYGGFSGTSESTTTRIINGRKETVTRKVDENGNVTVHTSTPEGSTVHVNGVQQAHHPLLGNAAAQASTALPGTPAAARRANAAGETADNPIVVESEAAPSSQAQTHGHFGTARFNV